MFARTIPALLLLLVVSLHASPSAASVRPEAMDVLGRLSDCRRMGTRVLFAFDSTRTGQPELDLQVPAKDGGTIRRLPDEAQARYRELTRVVHSLFFDVFANAGFEVTTDPVLSQPAAFLPFQATPEVFLQHAKETASAGKADYVFLYYVTFKDAGYNGANQSSYEVQDTLVSEIHRVADGKSVASTPFRATGRSDVGFDDAHSQNIQRLADQGLDSDLAIQVLNDTLELCALPVERPKTVKVQLYYQVKDRPAEQVGELLSNALKSPNVNVDGLVSKGEPRTEKGESYQEFTIDNSATPDEIQTYLYDVFIQQNDLAKGLSAKLTTTDESILIELLDEKRGGNWQTSALNPDNAGIAVAEARVQSLTDFELSDAGESATVIVEGKGAQTTLAAGALVTSNGLVVTDAKVAENAETIMVHVVGLRDTDTAFPAHVVEGSGDSRIAVLQLENFLMPPDTKPLELGEANGLRAQDKVYAPAPRNSALSRGRGRYGMVEEFSGSQIIHNARADGLLSGAPLMNARGQLIGVCVDDPSLRRPRAAAVPITTWAPVIQKAN